MKPTMTPDRIDLAIERVGLAGPCTRRGVALVMFAMVEAGLDYRKVAQALPARPRP